jgi:hypothetical protein
VVFILGLVIGSGGISGVCSTTSRKRLPFLTMYSHPRNAASSRPPLSSLPHKCGLSRRDTGLSSMARSFGIRRSARCRCPAGSERYRTPHLKQHRQQTKTPLSALSTCARRPQVGQTNSDQLPRLGNLRSATATDCSTSPTRTRNSVVSAVMIPIARKRETEAAGRSSTKRRSLPTKNWVAYKLSTCERH